MHAQHNKAEKEIVPYEINMAPWLHFPFCQIESSLLLSEMIPSRVVAVSQPDAWNETREKCKIFLFHTEEMWHHTLNASGEKIDQTTNSNEERKAVEKETE